MRNMKTAVGLVILMVAMGNMASGQQLEDAILLGQNECMTEQLLRKLASCEKCTKEQAAYLLGEARCEKAVIPLMSMLRSEDESARIIAALALCRIADARGTYAVKRSARFDESAKVRRLCAWFYEQYVEPGSFAFVAAEPPIPTLVGSR